MALIKLIAHSDWRLESDEPHRRALFARSASSLHAHWTRGKDRPQLRFLNEERTDLTAARLALITALATVLASGLGILGVNAPEEMR
jgi:arginyl-tRNA synthetase